MHREVHSWWSPSLNKHMEIAVYGHWGFALLMFPTAMADYLEYERFSLIGSIAHFIDAGKCKVFSINSINSESWMNSAMHPADRAWRHQQYNDYVVNEVVPFIWDHCRSRVMIITSGASLGAFHAANTFFRRPDLFDGVIAMSGTYDVKMYCDGYYDDNCYFNSPIDYLPNLNDDYYLPLLRQKRHIYIVSGQGAYEGPQHSRRLSEILTAKGIPHELDLWGHDIPHEWWAWHKMLPHYLGTRF
ncbi:MAG: alpha/beta hydrolase-fold protein [candidate division KSB1 bacterium]|nr:alpha/beta hydrolase-fold protein [candidate division KSB1 bacterium]